jgi:RNA polymerase nonessential primary-like sigma factor
MSAFYLDSPEDYLACRENYTIKPDRSYPDASYEVEFAQITGEQKSKDSTKDLVKLYLQDIGRVPLLNKEEEIEIARKIQRYLSLVELREQARTDLAIDAFVKAIQAHDCLAAQLSHRPSNQRCAKELNLSVRQLKQIIAAGKQRWAEIAKLEVQQLEEIQTAGLKAKKKMIESNLRLVVSIAKKYQNRGLELLDLIQEGTLGLERAVEKFDPTKGYRFSTYSYWWIRQGITRAIATQSRAIRIPVHITEKLNKIKKAQRQISQSLGRTATIEDIAQKLNMTSTQVREVLSKIPRSISLEIRVGEDRDTELAELIETEYATPEETLINDAMQQEIDNIMADLSQRERRIVELRFGFEDGKSHSFSDIARILGISRERVRQIQTKALQKLRQPKQRKQMRDYFESLS